MKDLADCIIVISSHLDNNIENVIGAEYLIYCMTRINLGYAHAGFPFKLSGFLATGKPVIVSCGSDVVDFIVDRKNAILVNPGDVAEL